MGDHISWFIRENRPINVFCMSPKYDLIIREEDGEMKIKQIVAIDLEGAIAQGKLESSDLKGIVYSDQNEASSM